MDYEVKKLTKDLINLKDWEFEFQQRAEEPILLADWFCRAILNHFNKQIKLDIKYFDYIFTDSSKGYNKIDQKKKVLSELLLKTKDEKSLKEILEASIKVPESFNAVADEMLPTLEAGNVENKKLAEYWEKMDQDFIKVIPWFWYPYYLSGENMLTDKVKNSMEKYRNKIEEITDFDEALLLVVFPVKKTGFQLEQEFMYRLVSLAQSNQDFSNDSEFKDLASEYLKKYDWLTTFILSPLLPMTYDQLVERVKEGIKTNLKENFEIQREKLKDGEEQTEKILKLFKSDEELNKFIDDARELGYVLTAGIEEAYVASSRYLKFLQIVAERIGVKFEDTKYLLSKEIYQALINESKIDQGVVASRRSGFTMMILGGEQYISFGSEGHDLSIWIDMELNKVDSSIKELKGQSASKGFSRAKVKIALTPGEAHNINEGDILVCPMTNPDYVPAMKKASAVITDEGGLLSHAAIMSREFGKPCVIATKIATKLLKDGDLVEVDANKGIVRILN